MPRLNVVTPAAASGRTKELYDAIARAIGGVPNIYQGVGNSAPALGAVLGIGEALKQGQLRRCEDFVASGPLARRTQPQGPDISSR